MDYTDTLFWLSLLPAIIILMIGNFIFRHREKATLVFHKWLLLFVSLTLLGVVNWQTLTIFLFVTTLAHFTCKVEVNYSEKNHVYSKRKRKIILWILIPILLLPLLYYKYGYFIGSSVFFTEWDTLRDLIIPIGISFYTFQIVGFCIDTLMRDEPMPDWIDYMNFGSYFPQIVAGPIERREDLLPQMQKLNLKYDSNCLNEGIRYMILGLFYKMVLADNLSAAFWEHYSGNNAYMIWANNLLFTFRIYFDFAGYGLCAYGLARCMGITIRMNFLSPYTSSNISDFWRRWHTSLTLWFRDYIYFPLGGSRTKRWALNLIIIFLISGLWHGAGWNFIMWGGFAGIFMVIHRLFNKAGYRLWSPVGWFITFGLMVFVWMFFYETDLQILNKHLFTICQPEAYNLQEMIALNWKRAGSVLMLPFISLSFLIILIEYISGCRTKNPYQILLHPVASGIMVFLLILLQTSISNQFIYFAF